MAASTGRPRGSETRRRTRELLAYLADGLTLRQAAKEARVKPDRVLGLLEEDEFLNAYLALRDAEQAARAA